MSSYLIITAGLLAGLLLFWQLPQRKLGRAARRQSPATPLPSFSVIIPMRNEACKIGGLLADLSRQTLKPLEIICVDDGSDDNCPEIALLAGATVLTVHDKPAGWLGKSYACHLGAQKARGKILVFLDADVNLKPDALLALIACQVQSHCTLSVQPYHRVCGFAGQFSLIFNLVLIAGSGIGLPFHLSPKLMFGPVIAVEHGTYDRLDGHNAVKGEILEDVFLGQHYARNREPIRLLIGNPLISFTMYDRFSHLWEGWSKNFFAGAFSIPAGLMFLTVLMVSGYCSAAANLIFAFHRFDPGAVALAVGTYLLCVLQIGWSSRELGNFHPCAILFYPVFLVMFCLIFIVSAAKKLIFRKTRWKGRDIPL